MRNQSDFTKKLLNYSVAGAAVALTAGSAQGAIIANTTSQTFDGFTSTFAFINFDGIGGNEFEIQANRATSTFTTGTFRGQVRLYRPSTVPASHFEDSNPANGGGNSDPNALPFGFLIGAGGVFNNELSDSIAITDSGFPTFTGGNFANFVGQVRYIGTQLQIGGNAHFGWIGIRLNSNMVSGTVTCYAYEGTPGQAIAAGDTGGRACGDSSGVVPEPSSLALMAVGAAGLFALRRSKTA